MKLAKALPVSTNPKYLKKEDVAAVDNKNIKDVVRDKYSRIATQNDNSGCGCGCSCSDNEPSVDYTVFSENYENLKGYNPDADLGLGCGLPTQFAKINKGDTVVDLGSGAGNDCFVALAETGENGKVIGVDFSDDMLAKAKLNASKLGFSNVEFIKGDIEDLPLESNSADVVVSNCVLNLVPDKQKAFAQVYRVLKPRGHFSISDVVLIGELPEKLREAAEMYAGCVSGAMQKNDYMNVIHQSGFVNVVIQKEKIVEIPDSILLNFLSNEELAEFKQSNIGIYSITVYGEKNS
jgi:arsenite methyltransferase